jgi:hypothetical protein
VLFRSLRSLAGRTLAAGAASAVALTLFNAAQPSLGDGPAGKPRPGTLETVKVALTPVRGPAGVCGGVGRGAGRGFGRGPAAGSAGAVDSGARVPSGSATLPLRGPEPGTGSVKAAPTTAPTTSTTSTTSTTGPAAGPAAAPAGRRGCCAPAPAGT